MSCEVEDWLLMFIKVKNTKTKFFQGFRYQIFEKKVNQIKNKVHQDILVLWQVSLL